MKNSEQITGLKQILKGKEYLILINQCFDNAMRILQIDKRITYCEGLVECRGLTLRHAWNSFNGEEFDLTAEYFMTPKMQAERVYYKEYESSDIRIIAKFRNAHIEKIEKLRKKLLKGDLLTNEENEFLVQNM